MKNANDIAGKKFSREFSFERETVDKENRTVALAFSSELPVERFFGLEILDHGAKSVRLGRLNDGAPLLLNHDFDKQIGVVGSVELSSDRVGRAVVRFGRSALADEIFNDVVDGIRKKVSVGYQIHNIKQEGKQNGSDVFRVTDWEPLEISIVSVPADNTVGVGRSQINQEGNTMIEEVKTPPVETRAATVPPAVDTGAIERAARDKELQRAKDLLAMGETYKQFGGEELARQYVAEGKPVGDLQMALLERAGKVKPMKTAEIGMTEKERQRFSFVRALAYAANPKDKAIANAAGFEIEASDAARALKAEIRGNITIPQDVLMHRDLTAGTNNAGGYTVQTDVLAASFIDLLRNRLAITQVGATMLTGLNGNVAIPKQTAAATAYWVAENTAPTESQQTLGQVSLTPKTVGAYTDYSRRLLLQSSIDVEAFVKNDLAAIIALAIDSAAINGTGSSNQPTGILNTAGIGSVAGGTNGATVTWANLVALETAVATANADIGALAYLTNAKQRGVLKTNPKISGYPQFLMETDQTVNGYKCAISNQVPSTLTKGTSSGVCSAILFGNFTDLLIGMWGGLDILVDPYTGGNAGTVRINTLQDIDINVRNAVSFAAMQDAL